MADGEGVGHGDVIKNVDPGNPVDLGLVPRVDDEVDNNFICRGVKGTNVFYFLFHHLNKRQLFFEGLN